MEEQKEKIDEQKDTNLEEKDTKNEEQKEDPVINGELDGYKEVLAEVREENKQLKQQIQSMQKTLTKLSLTAEAKEKDQDITESLADALKFFW